MNTVLPEKDGAVAYLPPSVCLMEFRIQEILMISGDPEEEDLY